MFIQTTLFRKYLNYSEAWQHRWMTGVGTSPGNSKTCHRSFSHPLTHMPPQWAMWAKEDTCPHATDPTVAHSQTKDVKIFDHVKQRQAASSVCWGKVTSFDDTRSDESCDHAGRVILSYFLNCHLNRALFTQRWTYHSGVCFAFQHVPSLLPFCWSNTWQENKIKRVSLIRWKLRDIWDLWGFSNSVSERVSSSFKK